MRTSLFLRLFPLFFVPPDDPPTGGGGGPKPDDKPSSAEHVAALVAKYGDAQRALGVLAQDNLDLREWRRNVKANPASLLPEGSVIVSKEDAASFASFKALGKTPDQLKASVDNEVKLQGQLDTLSREAAIAEVATSLKWKATILTDLATTKGLEISQKDETVDGKVVKKAYVRPAADKNAPLESLEQYVTQKLPDYLPALKEQGSAGPGTVFPLMQGTKEAPVGGQGAAVDAIIAANAKRASAGNPLRPAPAQK